MSCKNNTFKTKLQKPSALIGLWSSLVSTNAVELLSTVNYDWFLLDMEHAPNELNHIINQLRVLDNSSSHGFVRPAQNDRISIKRLLDAGVKNFLFPYVENAEQAQQIIRATQFPPLGNRGVSTAGRAAWYGYQPNYLHNASEELVIAMQIETLQAAQSLADFTAIEEIDILFFGPADLSADMGLLGQPEHPEVKTIISNGIKQVIASGKVAGVLAPNLELANQYYQAGARFIAVGSDLQCLRNRAAELFDLAKQRFV